VSRPKSGVRLFSVEEANALIPKLELIMERMQLRSVELRQALDAAAAELDRPLPELEEEELLAQRPELYRLVEDMKELVGEIEAAGGEFKGLDLGLVDFPAEIEGQVAYLCWQYGEKEITHWHPVEGGFAGRRPLSDAKRDSYLQ
jgi:hypothetical protein